MTKYQYLHYHEGFWRTNFMLQSKDMENTENKIMGINKVVLGSIFIIISLLASYFSASGKIDVRFVLGWFVAVILRFVFWLLSTKILKTPNRTFKNLFLITCVNSFTAVLLGLIKYPATWYEYMPIIVFALVHGVASIVVAKKILKTKIGETIAVFALSVAMFAVFVFILGLFVSASITSLLK